MENRTFLNRSTKATKSSSIFKVLLSVAVTSILLVVLIPLMMNAKGKGNTKKAASDKFKVVKEMPRSAADTTPDGLILNTGTQGQADPTARDQQAKPDGGLPGAGPLPGAPVPTELPGKTAPVASKPPAAANPPASPFAPAPSPPAPTQVASLPPAAPVPARPAAPAQAPSPAPTHSPPAAPPAAAASIPGHAPSAAPAAAAQPPSGAHDNKTKPASSSSPEKIVKAIPGNGGNPRAGSSSQVKVPMPSSAERAGSDKHVASAPAATGGSTGAAVSQKSREQASGNRQAQAQTQTSQNSPQKPAAGDPKDKAKDKDRQPAAAKDKKKQDNGQGDTAGATLASVSPAVKAKEKEPARTPTAQARTAQKEPAATGGNTQTDDASNNTTTAKATTNKRNLQYVVQFGAFHEMKNAEMEQEKLKKKGYSVRIRSHFDQKKGQLFLVQMEPVDDVNTANNMLSRARQEGAESPIMLKVGATR